MWELGNRVHINPATRRLCTRSGMVDCGGRAMERGEDTLVCRIRRSAKVPAREADTVAGSQVLSSEEGEYIKHWRCSDARFRPSDLWPEQKQVQESPTCSCHLAEERRTTEPNKGIIPFHSHGAATESDRRWDTERRHNRECCPPSQTTVPCVVNLPQYIMRHIVVVILSSTSKAEGAAIPWHMTCLGSALWGLALMGVAFAGRFNPALY
jgi:hypothetical protein